MAVQIPAQRVGVRRAAQMDVRIAALKADLTTVMRVRVAVNVRQKVVLRSVVKSALPMSYAPKARAVKSANRVNHVNRASHVKFANHANHVQKAAAKEAVQSVHVANAMTAVTRANGSQPVIL